MRFVARAALFLVGLALLAPGACSLAFLPMGLPTLIGAFDPRHIWESLTYLMFLGFIWLVGILLGALGLWMIFRAFRNRNRRPPGA